MADSHFRGVVVEYGQKHERVAGSVLDQRRYRPEYIEHGGRLRNEGMDRNLPRVSKVFWGGGNKCHFFKDCPFKMGFRSLLPDPRILGY